MTWEISMGPDGWAQLVDALNATPHRKLVEGLANAAVQVADTEELDAMADRLDMPRSEVELDMYDSQFEKYRGLPKDVLVDEALRVIEDHRSCSNGGHEVYVDPDGGVKVAMNAGFEKAAMDALLAVNEDLNGEPLTVAQIAKVFGNGGLEDWFGMTAEGLVLCDDEYRLVLEPSEGDSWSARIIEARPWGNRTPTVYEPDRLLADPNLLEDVASTVREYLEDVLQPLDFKDLCRGSPAYQSTTDLSP